MQMLCDEFTSFVSAEDLPENLKSKACFCAIAIVLYAKHLEGTPSKASGSSSCLLTYHPEGDLF